MLNVLVASVKVFVGDEVCSETSAGDSVITCKPPGTTPKGTDPSGKAAVTVSLLLLLMLLILILLLLVRTSYQNGT